jgi:Uma2 family endonuclease
MAQDILAPWAESVPDAPYPMTTEDFLRLPGQGQRYELVRGRLVYMPPPGGGHGTIAQTFGAVLWSYTRPHRLGYVLASETHFVLSAPDEPEQTILAPDVAYVRADRAPAQTSPDWLKPWRLAPDLIAEVASPDQHKPEMAAKARQWLDAGVRLAWIVWPKTKQVDVWRPGQATTTLKLGDNLDGLDVLPGFTYSLAELFG